MGDVAAAEDQLLANTRLRRRRVELVSVALLSLAGVGSAWSGYQAARWGGVQATDYSRAAAIRLESTRASSSADQLRAVDIAMFMNWVNAYAAENELLMQFYERRFREEFRRAFQVWLDSHPRTNSRAAASPFALAVYEVAKDAEAAEFAREAEAIFVQGQEANRRSDAYVFTAVLFALVMFFTGITQQFRIERLQLVLLSVAAGALLFAGINVLSLPKLP
jgi:hypothetical protein